MLPRMFKFFLVVIMFSATHIMAEAKKTSHIPPRIMSMLDASTISQELAEGIRAGLAELKTQFPELDAIENATIKSAGRPVTRQDQVGLNMDYKKKVTISMVPDNLNFAQLPCPEIRTIAPGGMEFWLFILQSPVKLRETEYFHLSDLENGMPLDLMYGLRLPSPNATLEMAISNVVWGQIVKFGLATPWQKPSMLLSPAQNKSSAFAEQAAFEWLKKCLEPQFLPPKGALHVLLPSQPPWDGNRLSIRYEVEQATLTITQTASLLVIQIDPLKPIKIIGGSGDIPIRDWASSILRDAPRIYFQRRVSLPGTVIAAVMDDPDDGCPPLFKGMSGYLDIKSNRILLLISKVNNSPNHFWNYFNAADWFSAELKNNGM